jgi:hypothetical protein
MPYIPQKERKFFDCYIDGGPGMSPGLREDIQTEGQLNYVMTRLAIEFARRQGGNYAAFAKSLAAFEAAKLEFYRRHVAPYEDKKIAENGDVT